MIQTGGTTNPWEGKKIKKNQKPRNDPGKMLQPISLHGYGLKLSTPKTDR